MLRQRAEIEAMRPELERVIYDSCLPNRDALPDDILPALRRQRASGDNCQISVVFAGAYLGGGSHPLSPEYHEIILGASGLDYGHKFVSRLLDPTATTLSDEDLIVDPTYLQFMKRDLPSEDWPNIFVGSRAEIVEAVGNPRFSRDPGVVILYQQPSWVRF